MKSGCGIFILTLFSLSAGKADFLSKGNYLVSWSLICKWFSMLVMHFMGGLLLVFTVTGPCHFLTLLVYKETSMVSSVFFFLLWMSHHWFSLWIFHTSYVCAFNEKGKYQHLLVWVLKQMDRFCWKWRCCGKVHQSLNATRNLPWIFFKTYFGLSVIQLRKGTSYLPRSLLETEFLEAEFHLPENLCVGWFFTKKCYSL